MRFALNAGASSLSSKLDVVHKTAYKLGVLLRFVAISFKQHVICTLAAFHYSEQVFLPMLLATVHLF